MLHHFIHPQILPANTLLYMRMVPDSYLLTEGLVTSIRSPQLGRIWKSTFRTYGTEACGSSLWRSTVPPPGAQQFIITISIIVSIVIREIAYVKIRAMPEHLPLHSSSQQRWGLKSRCHHRFHSSWTSALWENLLSLSRWLPAIMITLSVWIEHSNSSLHMVTDVAVGVWVILLQAVNLGILQFVSILQCIFQEDRMTGTHPTPGKRNGHLFESVAMKMSSTQWQWPTLPIIAEKHPDVQGYI